MKGLAITVIILSGFYVGATKVIMSQLKDLENFYTNSDKVAAAVAEGKGLSPYTQSLKNIQDRNSSIIR